MSKNILFVVPTLSGGGAERVVSELSQFLDEKGYNVVIAAFNEDSPGYDYGGELVNMEVPRSDSIFSKIKSVLYRVKELKRIKSTYDIDKSISFLVSPNIANILSIQGEQTIISVRNNLSRKMLESGNRQREIMSKHLFNKADKVVCISKGVKEDVVSNFGVDESKAEVAYNPCDVSKIQEKAEEGLGRFEDIFDKPVLINVGRLTKQKGQDRLIEIFAEVKKRKKDTRLVILGEGEKKQQLIDIAESYGLNVYTGGELSQKFDVFFLGFQDNPFKFMASADLFVFTSRWEGLGNVVLESMACGTLVISSDCEYGPREIIAPNINIGSDLEHPTVSYNGVLVPENEGIGRWADTICSFLEDRKDKRDNIENYAKKYISKYEENVLNLWREII